MRRVSCPLVGGVGKGHRRKNRDNELFRVRSTLPFCCVQHHVACEVDARSIPGFLGVVSFECRSTSFVLQARRCATQICVSNQKLDRPVFLIAVLFDKVKECLGVWDRFWFREKPVNQQEHREKPLVRRIGYRSTSFVLQARRHRKLPTSDQFVH